MDVRCERCRVQYVFGEDQVGPDGLTVRCSNCGHVFLVKKKALVVTVPVKPSDLREAPVSTADLDRGNASAGATASGRGDAERARPWSLRNHRGDLYPFKDLSTLQKWIVERKAARDDEVSHLGGSWRRLGDMLELEPFFALVERAERVVAAPARAERSKAAAGVESRGPVVQPTLIDFPPARPVFPGPGHQPAPAKTERFPVAPEEQAESRAKGAPSGPDSSPKAVIADEGPVHGEIGPVSGREPAWTSHPNKRPAENPARQEREAPRAAKRSHLAPIVVAVGLAAAAAAVYLTNPGWLGLQAGKVDLQAAKSDLAQPSSPAQAETPPARPAVPVPGVPPVRPPPVAQTPQQPSGTPTPAGTPGSPSSAAPAEPSQPHADSAEARSGVRGDERGQGSSPTANPPSPVPAPAAPPSSAAAAAPKSSTEEQASPKVTVETSPPQERRPPEQPPKVAERPPKVAEVSPKRPPATAAESQKTGGLKRILADARRLRARGKPEAALNMYGRAVEVEPKNADALAGRGLCYLELSQYGPAEASFHAALEADARHAEALMGLAETYRYEGRRTEAVTYYQRYLAAHPDGEDAAAARNAIDALKE
jgi:predicted Zn finger-like uncharacterized protein